jgi:hypothetical protein
MSWTVLIYLVIFHVLIYLDLSCSVWLSLFVLIYLDLSCNVMSWTVLIYPVIIFHVFNCPYLSWFIFNVMYCEVSAAMQAQSASKKRGKSPASAINGPPARKQNTVPGVARATQEEPTRSVELLFCSDLSWFVLLLCYFSVTVFNVVLIHQYLSCHVMSYSDTYLYNKSFVLICLDLSWFICCCYFI